MVDDKVTGDGVPAPKIERVSLKTIQSEKKKETDKKVDEAVDRFLKAFNALTPEEKEIFLKVD